MEARHIAEDALRRTLEYIRNRRANTTNEASRLAYECLRYQRELERCCQGEPITSDEYMKTNWEVKQPTIVSITSRWSALRMKPGKIHGALVSGGAVIGAGRTVLQEA